MAKKINKLNSQGNYLQKAQRRARWSKILTVLAIILAVCLLVAAVFLFRGCQQVEEPTPPATTQPPQPTSPSLNDPVVPDTVITLVAGGDIVATDRVVASCAAGYDYTENFMDIAAIFSGADAAIVNLEANLAGKPYGSNSASVPQTLVEALAKAGVDFVQTANSAAITNGITGLRGTIDGIRQAGMEPIGTFASREEFEASQGFTVVNIGGIRVALVSFTKGMNGLGLPSGSEDCVNLLYQDYASAYQQIDEEGIKKVLQAAQAQQPDVTIALLHWGSEYNGTISARQEKIAALMTENGVDAIIGTHSHYVQQVVYDPEAGTVIAYSLGDLYSDAEKKGTNYSILLELEITRNNVTGETRITGCDYIPVYTLTWERDGEPMRVVRILETMAQYENNHVIKVSDAAYQNMKSALAKIKATAGLYE